MDIKRRKFLQRTGLGLLSLGIANNFSLNFPGVKRYYEILAEPNNRKLALLIGINSYSSFPPLKGCLTDVELQRELLINRFGFQPQDIVILSELQATRENIETVFREHLIKQVKTGDVVIFHFSGYGSKVKLLPDNYLFEQRELEKSIIESSNYQLANSLVPIDGQDQEKSNYVLLHSLAMLGRSLLTNKLTTVLDTSYQFNGKLNQGLLFGRSLQATTLDQINTAEIYFLENLIKTNNFDYKKWIKKNAEIFSSTDKTIDIFSLFSGTLLTSGDNNRLATEIKINGITAGLFTYYLTQYLWETTPASKTLVTYKRVNSCLSKITNNIESFQIKSNNQTSLFTYYLLPEKKEGAEGIITELGENNTVKLKLLGLPHNLIQNYGLNSWFTVPSTEIKLQIQSQLGLNFKAKVEGETTNLIGQLIHEWIRIVPKNINLIVALDSELTRIEKVDATSAFSVIEAVSLVVNQGEQPADCIFSKTQDQNYQLLAINGLPLVNTPGIANEAVKLAVKRVENILNNLLASKLWDLTINDGSSTLGVKASLETVEPNQETILQLETKRHPSNSPHSPINSQSSNLTLKTGTKIQYRLENYSNEPVYFLLVGVNSRGNPFSIYVPETTNQSLAMISPGQSLIFPQPEQTFDWIISNHEGISQTNIIFSQAPFSQTLATFASMKQFQGGVEKFITISEPVKVAHAILQDLHQASGVNSEVIGSNKDIYALNVNAWATFNFVYAIAK
jgi:hypothetical protein